MHFSQVINKTTMLNVSEPECYVVEMIHKIESVCRLKEFASSPDLDVEVSFHSVTGLRYERPEQRNVLNSAQRVVHVLETLDIPLCGVNSSWFFRPDLPLSLYVVSCSWFLKHALRLSITNCIPQTTHTKAKFTPWECSRLQRLEDA